MVITQQFERRGRICRQILERLPQWFGRPAATEAYIKRADSLPMFVARDGDHAIGFITLLVHNQASTEISVMGVDPDQHRRGIGRALIGAGAAYVKERGRTILFVRTLGTAHPDPFYERTRRFYRSVGFLPVEEVPDMWGPGTPSLLLVKLLAGDFQAGQ